MPQVVTLEVKDPEATVRYSLDFSDSLEENETLESVESSIIWLSGTGDVFMQVFTGNEEDNGSYLVGSPEINETSVHQLVRGGLNRNIYLLTLKATTSEGQVLVRKGRIPVKS